MSAFPAATLIAIVTFVAGSMSASLRVRPLRSELARARWAAEHDALTGLTNRTGLRRRFELDRAAGRARVVMLLDLDGFKEVNDTWGHQAGDALLVAVADRLKRACGAGAHVGRLGGDEFLVLLPWTDRGEAIRAAQMILASLGEPIGITAGGVHRLLSTAVSVGIASPTPDASWSGQLGYADAAMYRAKAKQGSAWFFADEGPQICPTSRTTSIASRYAVGGFC